MAPPRPLLCSAEGCEYATPEGTPNWDMMFNILNIHSQTKHGVAGHQAAAPAATSSRLEKLPRPVFSLNSSEATWNFTKTLWDAYISQTATTEPMKLQQLQAAKYTGVIRIYYYTILYYIAKPRYY
jgi:hypothetical protein